MMDPTFSWPQFGADLVVTIVGSFFAIVGALWIANRTFRRDIHEERRRSFIGLLIEINGNLKAIEHMKSDPSIMFPLERHVLDEASPHLDVVPPHVGEMIQDAALLIARYNASDPLSLDALRDVEIPLENAEIGLARFLKGDVSLPPEWIQWALERAES